MKLFYFLYFLFLPFNVYAYLDPGTTLKSNADIIAQIADDLNWSHNFSYHTNNNKRFYSFMLDLHQLQQRHSYIDYATYIVDGSMFDESSWKFQKE